MAKKGKGLRKKVKKVGRQRAKIQAKVIKVAAPVLTAAATLLLGPVAGIAVGAATAQAGRRIGATAARAEGKKGRAARKEGVKLRKKLIKSNLIGLGGGLAIGAGVTAATGGAATNILTGQLGKKKAASPGEAGADTGASADPEAARLQEALQAQVSAPGQEAASKGILGQLGDTAGGLITNLFGKKEPGDATLPPTKDETATDETATDETGAPSPTLADRWAALPTIAKAGIVGGGALVAWRLFFAKKKGA